MKHSKPSKAGTVAPRLRQIAAKLNQAVPVPRVELAYRSPWELLVATILSAQCTDQRVNQVTPAVFARYPLPQDLARAIPLELEALIKPTGFYKNKAKHLIGCAQAVSTRFGGCVPETMETLTTIPGVGRKTANVLLGAAFGQPAIVVDTHVKRVAFRLALTRSEDPEQIEYDLQGLFPREQWTGVSQRLLLHGRYICLARKPRCAGCPIHGECTWKGKLLA